MFIQILYKDVPELSPFSATQMDMSEEHVLLVNPNCLVRVMLEYIRRRCNLGQYATFDLTDDTGVLKGLFHLPNHAYAMDKFEHKKTYYIIVILKEPGLLSVMPQLNRTNSKYHDLRTKIMKVLAAEKSGSPTSPVSSKDKSSKSSEPTPTRKGKHK